MSRTEELRREGLPRARLRLALTGQAADRRNWRAKAGIAVVALVMLVTALSLRLRSRRPPALSERDSVVLAGFANRTGDPVFEGTMRQALSLKLAESPFFNDRVIPSMIESTAAAAITFDRPVSFAILEMMSCLFMPPALYATG